MNLLLELPCISVSNVYFMETRPNMLFDGIFTKINYCDEFFTMYGIYINIPVEISQALKQKIDTPMFSNLNKLETDILTSYMKSKPTQKPKTIIYKLTDFLQTKFTVCNNIIAGDKSNNLKISGIWENKNNEIGLSFKF